MKRIFCLLAILCLPLAAFGQYTPPGTGTGAGGGGGGITAAQLAGATNNANLAANGVQLHSNSWTVVYADQSNGITNGMPNNAAALRALINAAPYQHIILPAYSTNILDSTMPDLASGYNMSLPISNAYTKITGEPGSVLLRTNTSLSGYAGNTEDISIMPGIDGTWLEGFKVVSQCPDNGTNLEVGIQNAVNSLPSGHQRFINIQMEGIHYVPFFVYSSYDTVVRDCYVKNWGSNILGDGPAFVLQGNDILIQNVISSNGYRFVEMFNNASYINNNVRFINTEAVNITREAFSQQTVVGVGTNLNCSFDITCIDATNAETGGAAFALGASQGAGAISFAYLNCQFNLKARNFQGAVKGHDTQFYIDSRDFPNGQTFTLQSIGAGYDGVQILGGSTANGPIIFQNCTASGNNRFGYYFFNATNQIMVGCSGLGNGTEDIQVDATAINPLLFGCKFGTSSPASIALAGNTNITLLASIGPGTNYTCNFGSKVDIVFGSRATGVAAGSSYLVYTNITSGASWSNGFDGVLANAQVILQAIGINNGDTIKVSTNYSGVSDSMTYQQPIVIQRP